MKGNFILANKTIVWEQIGKNTLLYTLSTTSGAPIFVIIIKFNLKLKVDATLHFYKRMPEKYLFVDELHL